MSSINLGSFSTWAAIIQMVGVSAIAGYLIAAIFALLSNRNIDRARLLVAEGVLTNLSFTVAATLLRMINLKTWRQILLFSIILLLRTVLKKVFAWEKAQVLTMMNNA